MCSIRVKNGQSALRRVQRELSLTVRRTLPSNEARRREIRDRNGCVAVVHAVKYGESRFYGGSPMLTRLVPLFLF